MGRKNNTQDNDTSIYNWLKASGLEIWDTKFDLRKCATKILEHAKNGGLITTTVIAGVCDVTRQTIYNWKNSHAAFREIIELAESYSALATDNLHRAGASGEKEKVNAALLNRRAEKIIGLAETSITTHKIEQTEEELDAELSELERKLKSDD